MRLTGQELHSLADSLVNQYFKRRKSLTLTIGIVANDEQYIWGYGQHHSFDYSSAIYEIGSITKVFVTSLLSIMEKKGLVNLTDSIGKYIPELIENNKVKNITLEQLATHTSGLPRLPGNLKDTITNKLNPYENYKEHHLIDYLKSFDSKLVQTVVYSNLGMGLLGYILSTHMKQSLDEMIREEICLPLSLTNTTFHLHEDQKARLLPVYKANGKQVLHWDLDVLAGAGALKSTVLDLINFMKANLGLSEFPFTKQLQECHQPRHTLLSDWEVGLGWMVKTEKNGEKIYWHNGGTYGSTSFIGFHKEKKAGVVVLTNNGTSTLTHILSSFGLAKMPVDAIGFKLINSLIQSA
jgi:CubicO group peptidase (beta-lactamase class C family)